MQRKYNLFIRLEIRILAQEKVNEIFTSVTGSIVIIAHVMGFCSIEVFSLLD